MPYFYFWSSWPNDLKRLLHVLPHSDFHQVWCSYDHPLPSYSILAADMLWPSPLNFWFDLGHWSCMAVIWSTPPPSLKILCISFIQLWVDISHRIPLAISLQPLCMRCFTWPMHRGIFFPQVWNPWTGFVYSLYNFYGAMIMIKGCLQVSMSNVQAVFRQKFCYV